MNILFSMLKNKGGCRSGGKTTACGSLTIHGYLIIAEGFGHSFAAAP